MRRSRTDKPVDENTGGRSQAFYIDKILFNEVLKDAKDDDRSNSYIVNKILKEYYIRKKRVEKY